MKINLGASKTRIRGYVNVDIVSWADVTVDLNRNPLPMADNSVDVLFSYHTLEHVDNLLRVLRELHRVLKHGSWLLVGVPYVTLTEFNLVNPYHKHHFNEHSFDFFDPDQLLGSASEADSIKFRKVYHEFHYLPTFAKVPEPLRTWCRRHLFNVVQKIDFGVLAIKDDTPLPEANGSLQQRMREEFYRCLALRRPYETT